MSISTGKELIEKITDKADDFLERLKNALRGKTSDNKPKESSELVKKLKELEESYLLSLTGDNKTLEEVVPESLGLEKKEYNAKSNEAKCIDFEAKQYLLSVRENYKGKDDIASEIKMRLDEIENREFDKIVNE